MASLSSNTNSSKNNAAHPLFMLSTAISSKPTSTAPKKEKTILITVGTTLFEALVLAVSSPKALDWMIQQGYRRLIVQYGKGQKPSLPPLYKNTLQITIYDFKPTLAADLKAATVIVSHAGAGTVMEALRMKKRLVVVINTILMDNHQAELAHAMERRGHLFVVKDPAELLESTNTWNALERFVPTLYQTGDEYEFPRLLDAFFGF